MTSALAKRLSLLGWQALASRGQGEIAQLVEHTTENRGVPGSIPGLATFRSTCRSPLFCFLPRMRWRGLVGAVASDSTDVTAGFGGRRAARHTALRRSRPAGSARSSPSRRQKCGRSETAPHHTRGPRPEAQAMPTRRRALTPEEREQRRAKQRELVRASIEQLRTSDGWQAYLRARWRFPSFSWLIWRAGVVACEESGDLRRQHVIKRLRPDLLSERRGSLGRLGADGRTRRSASRSVRLVDEALDPVGECRRVDEGEIGRFHTVEQRQT
jgi:hypothetical protein